MSEISEFADRHIYPAVFEVADQIFPEFEFKKRGDHWVSGNKRKIDGSNGDSSGKVYIYNDRPYGIKDYRAGGMIAITRYLQDQGVCSSWIEAIQYLARGVNVQLPERTLSEEDIERINKKERQASLFEVMNDFFVASLLDGKGSSADTHRAYLDSRGYKDHLPKTHDDIHSSNKLEIGFIPSREKLKEYLKAKEINPSEIDALFTKGIGISHKLAIPLRFRGRIIGFAFRDVAWTDSSTVGKYLYSTGLDKSAILLGFKQPKNNDRDLILVEGVFDALHAQACGMANIAALGGTSLNPRQIELIYKSGYEKITLCLDNDSAGRENTLRAVKEITSSNAKIKVYVASLPEDFKDPDELIRANGIESFYCVIKNAKAWYIHFLRQRFERYNELGEIPDKEKDDFFKEAVSVSNKIESSLDLAFFSKELATLGKPFGLSKETIDNEIRLKREKAKQSAEIKKGFDQAQDFLRSGKEKEAIDLISNIGKQRNIVLSEAAYDEIFKPITREDIKATLAKEAGSFDTSLTINSSPLLIPSGAVSFIAGRTGRGKTTTLINLMINAARIPNTKPIVFFSYEENSRKIIMKALNTYIGKPFSGNNRACIYDYYNQKNAQFISVADRNEFLRLEGDFFEYLINSGRLIIVDSKDYSDELINKIYYLHKHKQIRAVFIDYIQRINLGNSNRNSRQEELKQICNDLADCAINTGLPFIIGSQFNRQANEDRTTLTLNNLSEAGDIERVANIVVAVDIDHSKNELYMKILKHRDGIAEVYDLLIYDGNAGKISNHKSAVVKSMFGG